MSSTRMCRLLMSSVCVLAIEACVDPEASGPPALHGGVDVCADCGMSILAPNFAAAALIEREGRREHAVFDDVGCMLLWKKQATGVRILEEWSGTMEGNGWVRVNDGYFVVGSDVQTPMDFHIVCCASSSAADAVVRSRGGSRVPYASVQPVIAPSQSNQATPNSP